MNNSFLIKNNNFLPKSFQLFHFVVQFFVAENLAKHGIKHYNELLKEIQTRTKPFSQQINTLSLERMTERFEQFADVDYTKILWRHLHFSHLPIAGVFHYLILLHRYMLWPK